MKTTITKVDKLFYHCYSEETQITYRLPVKIAEGYIDTIPKSLWGLDGFLQIGSVLWLHVTQDKKNPNKYWTSLDYNRYGIPAAKEKNISSTPSYKLSPDPAIPEILRRLEAYNLERKTVSILREPDLHTLKTTVGGMFNRIPVCSNDSSMLIIGVSDEITAPIEGVDSFVSMRGGRDKAANWIRQKLDNSMSPTLASLLRFEWIDVNGKTVLILHIPVLEDDVVVIDDKVPLRNGNRTMHELKPVDIIALTRQKFGKKSSQGTTDKASSATNMGNRNDSTIMSIINSVLKDLQINN